MSAIIHPTPEQKEFIENNYLKMEDDELAKELGVSKTLTLKWRKRLGLTKDKPLKEVQEDRYYFSWSSAKRLDFIVNQI